MSDKTTTNIRIDFIRQRIKKKSHDPLQLRDDWGTMQVYNARVIVEYQIAYINEKDKQAQKLEQAQTADRFQKLEQAQVSI